ncbi:MAG: porphobilinogen deaminase [Geoglossum umbratile]|nr:MAG: porphobilinogen deaminase [Geoglossum umbratile]
MYGQALLERASREAPPKGRPRKPSAKVLEVQCSLRTRSGSIQNEPSADAIAVPEREGREANLEEVASLITNLKETITQQTSIIANQNSVVDSFRADLAEIKAEQQSLKNQNAKLQEEIRSLRTQLDTFSASPPLTQSWVSVTASGGLTGPNKEPNRQLVINVGRVREEELGKVETTEAAKQIITHGMKDVEELTGAILKDFQVWRSNNRTRGQAAAQDGQGECQFEGWRRLQPDAALVGGWEWARARYATTIARLSINNAMAPPPAEVGSGALPATTKTSEPLSPPSTTNTTTIRIGSRKSVLALKQAQIVHDALQTAWPELKYEIHAMGIMGHKNQVAPLHNFGAKSLWTHRLEAGLTEGVLDLAVHSLKG